MSEIQHFLALMADALHNGALGEEGCADLCKALNGVPDEYHAAAFKAFLGSEDKAQDAPEDYLAVKTFDSSEFHVGDEIVESNGVKGIYVGEDVNTGKISVVYEGGFADNDWDKDKWHRTGRSFPAISAILEEIKKH